MPTYTAQEILDDNGYVVYAAGPPATGDFTLVVTERVIDKAANYISLRTGLTLPNMTGVPGAKTITLTTKQDAALQLLVTIMLREGKKSSLSNSSSTSGSSSTAKSQSLGAWSTSQSGSVGNAITASSALNNAANSPIVSMLEQAIAELKQTSKDDYSSIYLI